MFDELVEAVKAYCKWVFGLVAECMNDLRYADDPNVRFILSHSPKGLYVTDGVLPKGTKVMLAVMTFEGCTQNLQAILPAIGAINWP